MSTKVTSDYTKNQAIKYIDFVKLRIKSLENYRRHNTIDKTWLFTEEWQSILYILILSQIRILRKKQLLFITIQCNFVYLINALDDYGLRNSRNDIQYTGLLVGNYYHVSEI